MKGRLPRFLVLALTAAGFFALAKGRPRELSVEVDLSAARPASIRTVDLTLRREGVALLRREQQFGPAGAPASLLVTTRTTPGPAEVEVTVVDQTGAASRERLQVVLREEEEGAQRPRVLLPVR
jgi:hypothetical protein